MSDDAEGYVVLELARGERDALRVTRKRYQGKTFTDLRVYFLAEIGLAPTKKGVSIRDHELDAVIEALEKIRAKRGPSKSRQPDRRTGDLTTGDRSRDMEEF